MIMGKTHSSKPATDETAKFLAGMTTAAFASLTSAQAQLFRRPCASVEESGTRASGHRCSRHGDQREVLYAGFPHQAPPAAVSGGIRYFILLGDLPANRQVGYIAIGAAGNRPTGIGHYCSLAERYDRDAVAKEMEAAGYKTAQGGFGMWPDPDGLELQLFQPPAGLVTAAVPSDLPVETNGLVTPLGLDHVILNVRDINASLPYYHFVYGKDVNGARNTIRSGSGLISRTIHESLCRKFRQAKNPGSSTFASRSDRLIETP